MLDRRTSFFDPILLPIAPRTAIKGKIFKDVKGKAANQFPCLADSSIRGTFSTDIKEIKTNSKPNISTGITILFIERNPSILKENMPTKLIDKRKIPHQEDKSYISPIAPLPATITTVVAIKYTNINISNSL